ncbi:MAG: sigma-E processing peptidase SpoIIGA [Oscillospiraceae bacterium]
MSRETICLFLQASGISSGHWTKTRVWNSLNSTATKPISHKTHGTGYSTCTVRFFMFLTQKSRFFTCSFTYFAYGMLYNNIRGVTVTIYIDVLLIINLYINYFLVRGTAVLLHRELSTWRCLAAAAVGAVFSLSVLFPEMPFLLSSVIKLLCAAAIVLTAFGRQQPGEYLIAMLCFSVISFTYAGAMLALWICAAPNGMYYCNGVAYFDTPIIAVTIITILAYIAARLIRYYLDRKNLSATTARVMITVGSKSVELTGAADTGNGLYDPFSGKPVVICRAESINEIMPEKVKLYLYGDISKLDSIKLIPCSTISGETLIPVFSAGLVINGVKSDAVIGVSKQLTGTDCIFNPRLI